MRVLAIKGNIVLPDRVLENAVVECHGDRIANVATDWGASNTERFLDMSDHFVCPGFVDIHVHGAAGADYMDGTVEAVRTVNRAHARHGTT